MIPVDVPRSKDAFFLENYKAVTRSTDRVFLFACDQKIEHLNNEFYGPGISLEDNDPEHMFRIAHKAHVGLFATHLGLLVRYAASYPTLNYLVKLNGKTNLVSVDQHDPVSLQLWSVDDVVRLQKETALSIRAVGYTIYLGSEFESKMLAQAAQIISQAHQHGLLTVLWAYPRGKAVRQERAYQVIAGAAGVAASLGADFVKVNLPDGNSQQEIMKRLSVVVQAAGRTKVIVSGGSLQPASTVVTTLYHQMNDAKSAGMAIGRNIHQRPLSEAVALVSAAQAIIYDNYSLSDALALL